MTLSSAVWIALRALRVNALRSLLAMLGVIIGVGSVIVMVSISEGAKSAVEEQINSLGANMLIIRPGSSAFGGRRGGAGTAAALTDEDVEALLNQVPGVVAASGEISIGAPVVAEGANWTTRVRGVGEQYLEIRDWGVDDGYNFSASQVRAGAKVAVVGQTVAEELFGSPDAVGRSIRIRNVPFQVVGVLDERGESSFGSDQDDIVFAPLTTVRGRLAGGGRSTPRAVSTVFLETAAGEDADVVVGEIEELLRQRRKVRPGAQDDFNVRNLSEFIRARNETERQLGLLLAWTGAIALIVGGIGIMNIMLVSVTERTREIGLRMALGARRMDIRAQFLIESVTLCLAGGLAGLAFGIGGSYVFAATSEMAVSVSPIATVIAIVSSVAVGVVFGFYPAHRAARLDPIDALRRE